MFQSYTTVVYAPPWQRTCLAINSTILQINTMRFRLAALQQV